MNFNELDFNEEFSGIFEALEHTRQHLFITGKAGTGKSTLLQYFRQKTAKKVAVLAPTGVAAVNIKGQTIHSFFQFKPDITPETVGDLPVRKRKRKVYEELDAVIIDEISMVRADLLDCVDVFLRLYGPHHDRPFGGIQMIFFGDLFQLPPVVNRGEEEIFKSHYPTPYFFSAKVFQSLDFKIMQLKKIYRQKDEHFIHLLNAVRDNNLEDHHLESINQRFKPDHQFEGHEFYIVLTTTNALADKVNSQRLNSLPGHGRVYPGVMAGEFDRRSLPTPESLELKPGAQVMLLNNDPDKRWVNGSLGKITRVAQNNDGEDVIMVELESGVEVDVKKYNWELYQYYFDENANALSSKVIGYFTQYPLKLAWAVTIHKSQGQTFEKVVIDVGWGTFAHGQMYVALSRCTSLEGLVLKQRFSPRHVLMDERVVQFMKSAAICALCFFGWHAAPALAQTPQQDRLHAVDQALSSVEQKVVDHQAWEEANADKPYLGLLSETDITLHNDWSYDEDYHARVKIQKSEAKSLGQWPVYYNKSREQVTDIEAFVETPDGRKLQATDIKDMPAYDHAPAYADLRMKMISMPEVKVGTIIDVRIKTKVSREQMPGQFWDQISYPSIPTKYARFSYVFPLDKNIQYRIYNNPVKPIIEKTKDTVKYSFVFEKTSYTEDEDFMPPSDDIIGTISLSSMTDWSQVADWFRGQIKQKTVEDPAIAAKAAELIKGKTSVKDKARAVLEFIQDHFRYVPMSLGDHVVDFHPTNEVFQNGYGDSKDLALLTRQMLTLAGIDANVCLFSGEFNGDPQHNLPSPSMFDDLILQISIDGKKYFVDPQTKGFDLGELPSSYDAAYVLVIGPKDYHFDRVPVASESFHSVDSSSDITIQEDGSAIFRVKIKLPVEASQDFKESWAKSTDANKQKFFDNLQTTFAQGGKIVAREVKGITHRYGPVEFDLTYEVSQAYQVVNNMILIREAQQGDIPDFADIHRTYNIFMPTNSLIKSHNIYHVPDGLKVDSMPQNYDLNLDFMQVSGHYQREGDVITVDTFYRMKRATLPVEDYASLQKFRDELHQKEDQYIVLKKKSTISDVAKDWLRKQ